MPSGLYTLKRTCLLSTSHKLQATVDYSSSPISTIVSRSTCAAELTRLCKSRLAAFDLGVLLVTIQAAWKTMETGWWECLLNFQAGSGLVGHRAGASASANEAGNKPPAHCRLSWLTAPHAARGSTMNKPLRFSGRMVKLGSGQSRASSEICTLDEHKQKSLRPGRNSLSCSYHSAAFCMFCCSRVQTICQSCWIVEPSCGAHQLLSTLMR